MPAMTDMTLFIGRDCEVIFREGGISTGYIGRIDSVDAGTIRVTPVAVTDGAIEFENGQPAHVPKTYPNGGRIAIDDILEIKPL
jgi:hypothetical protein